VAVLTINRGLVTSPNELARPDGAATTLDNCNIDSDNVVESRRGFAEFGNPTESDATVKQLMTYKGRIIRHFNDKLSFDSTGNGTFLNFSGSYSELVDKLRIKYFELNSNLYFTTNEGIKKISATSADDFAVSSNYITNAGGVKAVGLEGRIISSASGFLPAQSKVAYKILWAKKDANGSVIRGVPSSRYVITNTSLDVNLGESFSVQITTAGAGLHYTFNSTSAVASNQITITSHGYVDNQPIRFYGVLPEPLVSSTQYYVKLVDANKFEVRTVVSGAAIPLTAKVGSGNVYSGLSSSNYVAFDTPTNKYAAWFNVSGSDVAPTGADLVGRNMLEVNLSSLLTRNKENYAAKLAETLFNVSDIDVEIETDKITIINRDGGNVLNASQDSGSAALILVSTVIDGQTAVGTPANVLLTFTVPNAINSKDYFYEIYRTSVVTVQLGLTLNDIDPGEEFQKVYEAPVVEGNLSIPSEIIVEDIVPEAFREGGSYLYTNPVTGEGIVNANEAPPIALDVAVFKNSAFYANTKERHRLQFNLLSVSQFISGTSKLYIGNSSIMRTYTFIGENEVLKFTAKKKSETVGGSYFDISSAQNKVKYRVWFDKGTISHSFDDSDIDELTDEITITNHGLATNDKINLIGTSLPAGLTAGTYYVIRVGENEIKLKAEIADPAIDLTSDAGSATINHTSLQPVQDSRILLRVVLEKYLDTVEQAAEAFEEAFFDILDFEVTDLGSGEVEVVYTDNGQVDEVEQSIPPTGWLDPVRVDIGIGEDASENEVLLSGLSSEGLSIEDTARSLERVINKDSLSPVNAFYLSGLNDLPGVILLEARTLVDDKFYVGFSQQTDTPVFEPNLPVAKVITSVTSATPEAVFTTSVAHDFTVGQEVYAFVDPSTADPILAAKRVVSNIFAPSTTTFALSGYTSTSFSSFDTAIVFPADVVSDNSVNPNRVYFSKIQQPEAVPLINYIDIGPKDKKIQRILALRDSLVVLKEDGVYIISGSAAPNFTVRLSDSSAITYAPDTATNLNNLIYVLTSQGVVTVSETGVGVISRNIENKIQEITNAKFDYKLMSWGMASESDRCYLLWLPEKTGNDFATQAFRYNTFTRAWTRWTKPANCGVVNPLEDKIYLGDASGRPYVLKERKNFERQDYSDREIIRSLGPSAINGLTYTLSSVAELATGDVLTQIQYLDINKFNRFLKKLDRDNFSTSTEKYVTLLATIGDSLSSKLSQVSSKLQSDGVMVPSYVVSDVATDIRDSFNAIVDYINLASSGTNLKNYKRAVDELVYEVLITSVDNRNNTITVKFTNKFVEGNVSIFKGIKCLVEYAPQHFGKPESTKQVAEGTFIFDQNNFWGGSIAYSSDRSYDYSAVEFSGKGPGYWDGYSWANVTFGGLGNEVPVRTLIPRDKSRCRYLHVQFTHINARESWKLIGVSLEPREISTRGYR
jgi:hypothetical protein